MPLGLVTEPSYDSAGFWKGCNEAGCTHAIFSDFIAEMTNLSNRIQSGQASQEGEDRLMDFFLSFFSYIPSLSDGTQVHK